ncbi:MAG: hypothetical protein FWH48_08690 [Oscillospiraceae bacterium]|nr:hypothetical protein [Oscillospiraceae bacterium]
MNNTAKIFALIMAAVMLAAALCACEISIISGESGEPGATPGGESANTPGPNDSGDTPTDPSAKIDHPIVGLWSASQLPSSWAFSSYNTYDTATHMVTEITESSGGYAGSVDIEVYREDGTGFTLFLTTNSYFYTIFDWRADGDTIYLTNQSYTQYIKNDKGNFENKSIADTWILFKIENTADYVRMINFNPSSYSADSEYRSMTIDEYAAEYTTYVGWYYKEE